MGRRWKEKDIEGHYQGNGKDRMKHEQEFEVWLNDIGRMREDLRKIGI